MTNFLLTAWDWEPSVVLGCTALAIAYLLTTRFSWRTFYFMGGVLLLLLDLVSPIDALADGYLLSAHIVQHFLLALVIPPLLLLGLRGAGDNACSTRKITGDKIAGAPNSSRLASIVLRPFIAWPLGVGTMLIWHIPAFFNAALANEPLHIFQHLSFLATGVIFWWPVLSDRLPAAVAVPYLFSACTACSLLGAAITFSSPGLYPAYLHPADPFGILPLLPDPKSDQQLGGLLMWVPGCVVYLSAILATLSHWYRTAEA